MPDPAPAGPAVGVPEPPDHVWLRDSILYSPYWWNRLDAVARLVAHYKPFVVGRAVRTGADADEVVSLFADRVCRASYGQKWRPDYGFSRYVSRMIGNAINDYFRVVQRRKDRATGGTQHKDALDAVVLEPDSDSTAYTRTATPRPGGVPPKRVVRACREACLAKLTGRNRQAIRLLDTGKTTQEAAAEVGTTPERVYQVSLRLKKAVEKRLKEAGWDVPTTRPE